MLQKKFPPFKHSYIAPVQNEIKTALIGGSISYTAIISEILYFITLAVLAKPTVTLCTYHFYSIFCLFSTCAG